MRSVVESWRENNDRYDDDYDGNDDDNAVAMTTSANSESKLRKAKRQNRGISFIYYILVSKLALHGKEMLGKSGGSGERSKGLPGRRIFRELRSSNQPRRSLDYRSHLSLLRVRNVQVLSFILASILPLLSLFLLSFINRNVTIHILSSLFTGTHCSTAATTNTII